MVQNKKIIVGIVNITIQRDVCSNNLWQLIFIMSNKTHIMSLIIMYVQHFKNMYNYKLVTNL